MYFNICYKALCKSFVVQPVTNIRQTFAENLSLALLCQMVNGMPLYDFACVSWNYTLEDWSTQGCSKGNYSEGFLRCFCNHTTNFAALWVNINSAAEIKASFIGLNSVINNQIQNEKMHREVLWKTGFCFSSSHTERTMNMQQPLTGSPFLDCLFLLWAWLFQSFTTSKRSKIMLHYRLYTYFNEVLMWQKTLRGRWIHETTRESMWSGFKLCACMTSMKTTMVALTNVSLDATIHQTGNTCCECLQRACCQIEEDVFGICWCFVYLHVFSCSSALSSFGLHNNPHLQICEHIYKSEYTYNMNAD